MIVDRRSQDEHVCIPQLDIDLLHIIMLHTLALPLSMAVFASEAAFDVLFANVDDRYFMPCFFCTFFEHGHHFRRVAMWPGAPIQN